MGVRGRIRTLNADRGFGFLTPLSGGRDGDHFLHNSGCAPGTGFHQLTVGALVEFDSHSTPKGLRAENIRLIRDVG